MKTYAGTIGKRLAALERKHAPADQSWARVIVPAGADEAAIIAAQFPDGPPPNLIIRRIISPPRRDDLDA